MSNQKHFLLNLSEGKANRNAETPQIALDSGAFRLAFADVSGAFANLEFVEKSLGRNRQRYASALRAFVTQFYCAHHIRLYFPAEFAEISA